MGNHIVGVASLACVSRMVNTEKLVLKSNDNKTFEVEREIAEMSLTIKNLVEDIGEALTDEIPLPNVSGTILEKVLLYCRHHHENPSQDDKKSGEISGWDKEFCEVPQAILFDLILAANYLDIKPLLDLTCKTVADMIRGKNPEEVRSQFNIKNDFTQEEEEQVRKENGWCEDK